MAAPDDELSTIRSWMRDTLEARPHLTASSWAKGAGVAATTVTRHVFPKDGEILSVPKRSTLMKLAGAAGVPLPDINKSQYGPSHKSENNSGPVPISDSRLGSVNRLKSDSPGKVIEHMVPVLGYVEAGAWRDMGEFAEPIEFIPFPDDRYNPKLVSALIVRGDSVNLKYPPGAKVMYLSPHDIPLRNRSFVVVRRTDGALAETTLKQFIVTDGVWNLMPRSSNPKHQEPIVIPSRNEMAQHGIEIIGVVIGAYLPDEEAAEIVGWA